MEKKSNNKYINWLNNHLSSKQVISLLAFAIGIFVSFAAFVLHSLISEIQYILTHGFAADKANWLYLIFPVIGIYLTSLFVRHVVKDNISHGITRVLYAIATNSSHIKKHNCWSSVIASAITIGFGGSVGAEAPIVLTGSAIGSNLGQAFKMDNKTLMLLVGCGAAAAIAGIFKAPIAGLVFTLEVLMVDLSMASLLPILISCITATVMSYILLGPTAMFNFKIDSLWNVDRIPPYILFGIFCAAISLYFMRVMSSCEGIFTRLKNHSYVKLLLGGVVLSSLIFFFPSLYGEGYNQLDVLMQGNTIMDWEGIMKGSIFSGHADLLVLYVTLVLLTKVFATSSTNGAGGCGGTFAPSLFIGGFGGFLFARLWNNYQIGVYIPEKNFTLLGMAGVIAGVMHAPLTGIFLIAEITGGYQLFMPLMIVSLISVMAISIFEPHSIYAIRLAKEGKLITHHTDKAALTLMSMNSIVEKDYIPVPPNMLLGKLVHVISNSNSNFIPVLDESGRLLGEIDITKIRHVVFRQELYNRFTVSQIMTTTPAVVYKNAPMSEVMAKFDKTGADYLPVVDINNRLQGFISRTHTYSLYRKMVEDLSAE